MKMRIKEVAKKTGLTEKTIRYYESVGLVVPDMEMKDHRVWRDYSEKHARLLSALHTAGAFFYCYYTMCGLQSTGRFP